MAAFVVVACTTFAMAEEGISVGAGIGGIQRYGAGRWGMVQGSFANKTDQEREFSILMSPEGPSGNQFVRTLKVPARTVRTSTWPVHLDKGVHDAFQFHYIVLKGDPDSTDILSSRTSEQTENFISTNAGGAWSLRKNELEFSPGYCLILTSYSEAAKDERAVDRFAVLCREQAGYPSMMMSIRPDELSGSTETLDPADQMIILSPDLGALPDACDAIRTWIQRGGRAIFFLPQCGEETVRAILGDALPVSVVDTTTPLRVPLKHHPRSISAKHQDESHLREFEEPVTVVRCVPEAGNTVWSVRGWPVVIEDTFGSGSVVVAAISPEVFLNEDPAAGLDSIASRVLDQTFRARQEAPLIPSDHLKQMAEKEIGYEIPRRSFAAALLVVFTLALGGVAMFLRRKERSGSLLFAVPLLAVCGAIPGLIQGNAARNVAPPTLIEARIARLATGQSFFAADGMATLYRPTSDSIYVSLDPDASLLPQQGRPKSEGKKYIWTGRGGVRIPDFSQPAGASSYTARSVIRTDNPMHARGQLSEDGIRIDIANASELQPEDVILAGPGPDRMSVRSAGDSFITQTSDILAPNNFSNATLLSTEQNTRADLFRKLFDNDRRMKRFPAVPSLLFWTTNLPSPFHADDPDLRMRSWTLVSLPLEIEVPGPDQPVTIPAVLMPYRLVPDSDGSVSSVYSRRLAKWIQKKSGAVNVLRFDLPKACQPFQFQDAELQLRIRAGSRTVKIQGGTLEQLKEIETLDSPVTTEHIPIPGEILNLNSDGDSVLLRIAVSEVQGVDSELNLEQDNFWKIERVLLTVRGSRRSEN